MLGFELSLCKLRLRLVLGRLVVFFLEVVSECNARELGTCTSARDSQSSSQASARAFFGVILSIEEIGGMCRPKSPGRVKERQG